MHYHLNNHKILCAYGVSDPLSWTSEAMITNMIVLLCLSALFPVLMGAIIDVSNVKDCSDIYGRYSTSGVYTISAQNGQVQVYCEMVFGGQNDRENWMVILRRMDGRVNFYKDWKGYKWGFGDKDGEYWLGLEYLHQLTRRRRYELRVDVADFQGKKAYALYQSFSVSSEADGYKLDVRGFVNGGAGDSLSYHSGMKFSTFDKDNSRDNCALKIQGGFWYNKCVRASPTGLYLGDKTGTVLNPGLTWYDWRMNWKSLKSITMKIRRVM